MTSRRSPGRRPRQDDHADLERVAIAGEALEFVALDGDISERANGSHRPLFEILEAYEIAANGASQQELEAERIVDELDEAALQIAVRPGAAADGTTLHVGVMRIVMLHFVVDARGEPKEPSP